MPFVVLLLSLQACYEDFKEDFDYSTAYFSRQFPLRTLVDVPGEEMTFEVGAAIGGKYSNNTNEEVVITIQDSFLNADNFPQFTKLPDSYYTLESDTITIPSGKFFAGTKVTIDKEQFLNDPLAVEQTYALPAEIISATTDSILDGKHYSVIVIKFFNQYHGGYWLKGTDTNNGDNSVVTYSEEDLVTNEDMILTTVDRNSVSASSVGNPGFDREGMTLTINSDGSVVISEDNPTGGITNIAGTGSYDANTRGFTLNYSYTDGDGNDHTVTENLIYRNTEQVFEEWN